MTDLDIKSLARLRDPFPPEQIGKLPKGGVQLDFVGHGYLTARLLDVDPGWNWEPVAVCESGLPLLDQHGGLWIRLTVCGVTRLGYGDAAGRQGPNAIKEAIGDALRNAGMRFGLALDLWCKGDPDAQPAPTATDLALRKLLRVCTAAGLLTTEVGERFATEYGMPINKAEAAVIEGFTAVIESEAAAR